MNNLENKNGDYDDHIHNTEYSTGGDRQKLISLVKALVTAKSIIICPIAVIKAAKHALPSHLYMTASD